METQTDHKPSYRKMQVLGPRQAIALDDIATQRAEANALRDYNPVINAMAETKSEMRNILANAAHARISDRDESREEASAHSRLAQEQVGYSSLICVIERCVIQRVFGALAGAEVTVRLIIRTSD